MEPNRPTIVPEIGVSVRGDNLGYFVFNSPNDIRPFPYTSAPAQGNFNTDSAQLDPELVGFFNGDSFDPEIEAMMFETTMKNRYMPEIYYTKPYEHRNESVLLEILKGSVTILKGVAPERDARNVEDSVKHLEYALEAQKTVLEHLSTEFLEHEYCEDFKSNLDQLENYIITYLRIIRDEITLIGKSLQEIEELEKALNTHIQVLRKWDSRRSFLAGKSARLANVQTSKDLLTESGSTVECGICLSHIEETSDFGVQSDCKHIFCTPCISTWFQQKNTCPMCRQEGTWMNIQRLLALRDGSQKSQH